MNIFVIAAALLVLVIFSAFFSASETSFTSLSRLTLKQLVREKAKNAKRISALKANMPQLLSTILIGNNLVNNLSSSLATALAVSLVGQAGVGIATAVMTLVIIIFGETAPKTIAAHKQVEIAQKTAVPLDIIRKILFPVVWVFSGMTKGINFLINRIWKNTAPLVTEEELKTLIDVGNQEGTLETGEKEMLHRIFEFTDLKVKEIMRSRTLISTVPDSLSYADAVAAFRKTGFSRLPVYSGSPDTITGVLHYKDLLFYEGDRSTFSIPSVIRKALFVPDSKTAVSLFQLFRTEKQNLAVVVDEHGSNSGIVSMDDILKAVFGRITDEYAGREIPPADRIQIISQDEFLVPGDIELNDVNEIFTLSLDSEFYHTLGVYLLEKFDALPAPGEALRMNNVLFIVEEQAQRRIVSVRIKLEGK